MGISGRAVVVDVARFSRPHMHITIPDVGALVVLTSRRDVDVVRLELELSSPSDAEMKALRAVDINTLRLQALQVQLNVNTPESTIVTWTCAQMLLLTLRMPIPVTIRNPLPVHMLRNRAAHLDTIRKVQRKLTKLDRHLSSLRVRGLTPRPFVFVTPALQEIQPFTEDGIPRISDMFPQSFSIGILQIRTTA